MATRDTDPSKTSADGVSTVDISDGIGTKLSAPSATLKEQVTRLFETYVHEGMDPNAAAAQALSDVRERQQESKAADQVDNRQASVGSSKMCASDNMDTDDDATSTNAAHSSEPQTEIRETSKLEPAEPTKAAPAASKLSSTSSDMDTDDGAIPADATQSPEPQEGVRKKSRVEPAEPTKMAPAASKLSSTSSEMDADVVPLSTNVTHDPSKFSESAVIDISDTRAPAADAMCEDTLRALRKSLWPSSATPDDLRRWHNQGFVWSDYPGTRSFGLIQSQGGPCGVLAAVQAFIIRSFLFVSETPGSASSSSSRAATWKRIRAEGEGGLTDAERHSGLVDALVTIMEQCATGGRLVLVMARSSDAILSPTSPARQLRVMKLASGREVRAVLSEPQHEGMLRGPSGIALFLFSLLLTRGIDQIHREMDESTALTAVYGHCTQELMNLMLTGVATSQVFDGQRPIGDTGLVLRGVDKQPLVGFLTYLEAMRYLQVGSFYKNPACPIFLVGSSSHYTTLFCTDTALVSQSREEQAYKAIRRAFTTFDTHDNGFIPASDLDKLFDAAARLATDTQVIGTAAGAFAASFAAGMNTPARRAALRVACDPDSLGIILWPKFWSSCQRVVREAEAETNASSSAGAAASGAAWETQCRRAFGALDTEGNCFIATPQLGELLRSLPEPLASADVAVATSQCDGDGLGIVLWPQFWIFAATHPPIAGGAAASMAEAASSVACGRTFTMCHYNGLSRTIRGQKSGPRLVSFDMFVVPPGQIGGALPPKASKLEQVLRTRFKGASMNFTSDPPSIDG